VLAAHVAALSLGLSLVAAASPPQRALAPKATELSLVFFHDRRGELDPCG
jgi:hypothetical protein